MIIDRLRQDASFMRVLTRADGWQKALLIDEVEVDKISATMFAAAERIEALEARATPALPQGVEEWIAHHEEYFTEIRNTFRDPVSRINTDDLRAYLAGMAIVPAACMNPRLWTQEMHDAWHQNIPDVQAAFAAVVDAAKEKP